MSREYTTEQNIHERYCHFQTITLLIVSLNGWMCDLPLCGTLPLVLLAALQLLSEVNNVEIGVMSWIVVRSPAWENSPPPPVGSVSDSSPAVCL